MHTLLRAAGLPRAELLHMGATPELLANASEPLAVEDVAPLLGCIVLDALAHDGGDIAYQWPASIGLEVIEEWFV